MAENIEKQLNNQIYIFLGLSVVNLIYAATAMAMGVVFFINNFPMYTGADTLSSRALFFMISGVILSLIGFFWIVKSAIFMDFINDIQWQSSKKKGDESYDDKVIGLIVKIIAYYRKNLKNINMMVLVCRLGGIFYIVDGMNRAGDLIFKMNDSFLLSNHIMQFLSIILLLGWGIFSLFIPMFIGKVVSTWEYRVKKTVEAEEILREYMESK